MYALIRKKKGGYYGSMVFGTYEEPKGKEFSRRYYVVLNEEKTKLVKVNHFWNKPLSLRVLVTDAGKSDWVEYGDGIEPVDFLSEIDIVKLVKEKVVPDDLTRRCIEMDRVYRYEPVKEVLTADDVRDFDWVSGGLHDAYVVEVEEGNGWIRVLFDTTWGCRIEAWFSGDPSYDISFRDPEYCNPHWYESSVTFHNGFVHLVDDKYWTIEESLSCCCWFKGRSMRYRVIPD